MSRPTGFVNSLLKDLPILDGALCAEIENPDQFFIKKPTPEENNTNRALCGRCPAMQKCLEYALGNEIKDGFWGGKTQQERKAMLRPDAPKKKVVLRRSSLNTKAIIKMCESGVSYPIVAGAFKTNRDAVSQVMVRHRRSLLKLAETAVSQ